MPMANFRSQFGDTTYTKVFVGGLAWETPTEQMRSYFEQFGDILEAVIITDKNTGKSKGYGFVTFRDPESARRACAEPNPEIDGRKANCNIASLGRPRPSTPRGGIQGGGGFQGVATQQVVPPYSGVAGVIPTPSPPAPPAPVMYPPYGYPTYSSPPDYGYHQAIYNPQVQQAQYYHQYQHHQVSSAPYYYGYSYSMQGGRGTYSVSQPHRSSYLYYPAGAAPVEGSSSTTTHPPSPFQLPRRSFSSSVADSQTSQPTTEKDTGPGNSEQSPQI